MIPCQFEDKKEKNNVTFFNWEANTQNLVKAGRQRK